MSLKMKPEELAQTISYKPPKKHWMDVRVEYKKGSYNYAGNPESLKYVHQPNPRKWQPYEENWKLPENWKEIILEGFRERIDKFRSLKLFMDICVRCGACADKCHFFIGSGDPKNMPVLRAELLRAVYRKEFTLAGKLMAKMAGATELTFDVLKEWFYYFYQCTQCRRCSVFCPYGIDTAEITFIARELMNLIGVNIDWVMTPVANSHRTGNHLGIQPHGFKDSIEFARDDLEDLTGIRVEIPINKKGAEILFVIPSADYFAEPHYYTLLGYMALFHEIGLDFTFSTYASEGGNFGSFVSHELMKVLNAKIYAEAKRLKVKWILGGECGHMWRILHQYMDTLNGPADFLEVPKSPITRTVFENTRSTKMVHITEFTADLIKNNKIKLDKSRNDHWHATFHDSCNPARGMGLLEEPRYILKSVLNNFTEMPDNTIREQTFCCGSGAGLGTEENFEMRMRGGFPRANAVKYVAENNGVNLLTCICAIDKATLPPLLQYWVPGVEVGGIHELVGNALVMKGENERKTDLRNNPSPGKEDI
ncbi:MAG: menaquinol oxidoreductase [Ignavibacteria bacterium GWB2_35_12]|nr:MAG: menaquinol oxidoreductase [Ignavibacteria bacterium GWB2_35_12]OGU90184.1 MAG: menaquinol oxidoreductase [Ignavibacteria bacterium RIFOXYA2_FULL_35_10]OGV21919.1 MAG: menaquinol oxidoreductase [Ignavibacteria bacterium RIFOXYC2_FULL_35_21]